MEFCNALDDVGGISSFWIDSLPLRAEIAVLETSPAIRCVEVGCDTLGAWKACVDWVDRATAERIGIKDLMVVL